MIQHIYKSTFLKVAFKYFIAMRGVTISIDYLKPLMRNFSVTCKILN